jgi:hypothetical protein
MGEIAVEFLKLGFVAGLWLVGMWVGGAFVTAWVANEKDRSPAAWFLIAFLLSPLLALVALGAVPRREIVEEARVRRETRAVTNVRPIASGW